MGHASRPAGRRFRDRTDAGRQLATELAAYHGRADALVVALPRGGVPVAVEVARALGLPLDVCPVRRLGLPGHEELAIGAVAAGVLVRNDELIDALGVSDHTIAEAAAREQNELARREAAFRAGRGPPELRGRTAILIDDGVATGSTVLAATIALRRTGAARVVLGVPVASPSALAELCGAVDEIVCLFRPEPMYSVGRWYEDFGAIDDDEVRELLGAAGRDASAVAGTGASRARRGTHARSVRIPLERAAARRSSSAGSPPALEADLTAPRGEAGIVVFAHGSGSGRGSRRNRIVAGALHEAGFGTLLLDLLTGEEATVDLQTHELRFDIELLAARVVLATHWLAHPDAGGAQAPVGYFGASTGAAAAIVAAARLGGRIGAVVCRGGRPDLAESVLGRVAAPVLLIAGELDPTVLALNRDALTRLNDRSHLEVVRGASHLFHEPGALAAVADSSRDWFLRHLAPATGAAGGP